MTGVSKLLSAIQTQAEAEAQALLADAEQQAEEAKEQALLQAKQQAQTQWGQAELKAAFALEQAAKHARQTERTALLSTKHQAIERVFETALAQAPAHPRYFAFLQERICALARPGQGELRLGKRDSERLPVGFLQQINEKLAQREARIVLSAQPMAQEGGFLLRYPDVEHNETLPALLETKKQTLTGLVARVLCGGEAVK